MKKNLLLFLFVLGNHAMLSAMIAREVNDTYMGNWGQMSKDSYNKKMQSIRNNIANKKDLDESLLELSSENDREESLVLINQLLELGADPNYIRPADPDIKDDLALYTPLHLAALFGGPKIITMLLKYGANPNRENEDKCLPLHYACQCEHKSDLELRTKIVTILLKNKSMIDVKEGEYGRTPLDICLRKDLHGLPIGKLLISESRYRLFIEIESSRRKKLPSQFNLLPKDVIKQIILLVYPKMSGCS